MDFLEPRKLHLPELDQEITFPFESENETFVLLNVATIKQIPVGIFLLPLAFRTFTCSILAPSKSAAVSSFLSVEGLEVSSFVCLKKLPLLVLQRHFLDPLRCYFLLRS